MRLALLLFGCCLVAATVLRAQEPAVDEAETTEGTEGTQAPADQEVAEDQEVDAPASETGDGKESATEQGRKPGVVGPTPGRFEPTEKVRADFDVSFPVDI